MPDLLTTLAHRLQRWQRNRRDRATLQHMTAEQLDDLGITRVEIDDFLAGRLIPGGRILPLRPPRSPRLAARLEAAGPQPDGAACCA
ncbi:hypothetical protein LNKW23_22410 [Paralimibaculum aggregatum]|uniref:YjiS-like domain-containing protein n=1 Tax=Paralimibaculum aggregatum TaxID=3036245 RepID=A0ABQ6LIC0_9RHOB|nr:DUF1127 domain-containing protein [Limibaculum sp. NKW23]GMG83028.1 hypothetical protein LNKW23_22410 [Limibaculum sp. NKW23]